ncbi:MAG: sulfatase-like hydrolase/transferase [Acidobacteriota bacterium]
MSSKLSSPRERPGSENTTTASRFTRRDALKKLGAATAALGLNPALSGAEPAVSGKKRPHIFLIMADQLKASATSLHGNRFARTPTLERLAAQGVTFDHAYAQATICTPSRATIMTGTYPLVHRVLCHQNYAPENLPQLAELLSASGYRCMAAGHYESQRGLTRGWQNAFDENGTPAIHDALRALQTCGSRRVGWSAGETGVAPERSHGAMLNDELFARLDKVDPNTAPLFVHAAFLEPHAPYFAPRGYLDREVMRNVPLPALGEMRERPAWHAEMLKDFASAEATEEDIRRVLAAYYGNVRYFDEQLNRLLEYIERRGMMDNSWIIVTSDHGDYTGEKGFYVKSESAYECLQHVPLVIRAPGGHWHAGERVKNITELVDLFPTILSAAGCAVPRQAQGHNLIEWVNRGADRPLRAASFAAVGGYLGPLKTTMPHGLPEHGRRKGIVRSARSLNHVYIRDPDTGDEAYDLVNDPLELRDLLKDGRALSESVRALSRQLDQWEERCAAHFQALGVKPGKRNFDEPVPVSTGEDHWKPEIFLKGHSPA